MQLSLSRRSTSSKLDPQVGFDPHIPSRDWYKFLLMTVIAAVTVTISYIHFFPISTTSFHKMLEKSAGASAGHLGPRLKPAIKELEDVLIAVNRMIKNTIWAKVTIPLFHFTSEPILDLVFQVALVALPIVERTWKALAIDEPVANVTKATPVVTQPKVVLPARTPASSHWCTWLWTIRSRRCEEERHATTTAEEPGGQTIIEDSVTLVYDDGNQDKNDQPSKLRAALSLLIDPLFEDGEPTNSKASPLSEDNRDMQDDAHRITLLEDDDSDWDEVGSAVHAPKDDGEERGPALLIPPTEDDGEERDPACVPLPEENGEDCDPTFRFPIPEDGDQDPDVVDIVLEETRDGDGVAIRLPEMNEEPCTSRPLSNLTNTVYLPCLILPALPPRLPTNLTAEDQFDYTPSSKLRQVRPRVPTTDAASGPSTLSASDKKARHQRRRIKQKLNKKNKYLVPLLADIILDVKIETAPEKIKPAISCADAGRAVADDLEELPKVSADVPMDGGKENSPRVALPAPPIPCTSSILPSRQSATHSPDSQIPPQSVSAATILAPQPTYITLRQRTAHPNPRPGPSNLNGPGELWRTKNQLRRAKQRVNKRNKYLEPLLNDIVLDEYHRR